MKRFFTIAAALASALYLLVSYAPIAESQLGYNPEGITIATGTLTATQVRKLNATPVEVIAAPGSGKAVVIESVRYMMDWGGTAFDSVGAGEDLSLEYTVASGIITCDNSSCLPAGSAADVYGISIGQNSFLGERLNDNAAVDVTILSGEWASTDDDSDGNSLVRYRIRYRVVTLDLS